MHLIAIGRMRPGPEVELFERYSIRLRPRLVVVELPEERGASAVVKRRESAGLLAALPKEAFVVTLDLGGQMLGSEAFAQNLAIWTNSGRPICFLIGGADGLDRSAIDRADYVLSLGQMTWPHLLVRILLVEQLYRAQTIALNHPYHRSGRPTAS